MPWALLLDLRVLLGAALVATGIYAAVQRLEKQQCEAKFAQFRADVESAAAKAKVEAAKERARMAQNAQEALDGLQVRLNAANRAYASVRNARPGSGAVPSLSAAAPKPQSCPGQPEQPDATAGLLAEVESRVTAILEAGDREIAKYAELWKLQQANAAKTP